MSDAAEVYVEGDINSNSIVSGVSASYSGFIDSNGDIEDGFSYGGGPSYGTGSVLSSDAGINLFCSTKSNKNFIEMAEFGGIETTHTLSFPIILGLVPASLNFKSITAETYTGFGASIGTPNFGVSTSITNTKLLTGN